jgi:hypothetical protein
MGDGGEGSSMDLEGAASSSSRPGPRDDGELLDHDYSMGPYATVKSRIHKLHRLCSGNDEPKLDLDKLDPMSVPFRRRAEAVLVWALDMLDIAHDELIYNEPEVSKFLLEKMCLNRHLHLNLKATINELMGEPPPGTTDDTQRQELHLQKVLVEHEHNCFSRIVLLELDRLAKSVNVLTRILRNPADNIVNSRFLDGVRFSRECEILDAYIDSLPDKERAREMKQALPIMPPLKRNRDEMKVIRYCLDVALHLGYRRLKDLVYEEIKVELNGTIYGTRAFRPAQWPGGNPQSDQSGLGEFVTHACKREVNPEMWGLTVDRSMFSNVVAYLLRCADEEFPTLQPQRNLISFRNGIYDTAAPGLVGRFVPWHEAARVLPPKATAAVFHDQWVMKAWFDESEASCDGWWKIPTPRFQAILDYQNWGMPRPPSSADAAAASGEAERLQAARVELRRALHSFSDAAEHALLDSDAARTAEAKLSPLLSLSEHSRTMQSAVEEALRTLQTPQTPPAAAPAAPGFRRLEPGKELPQDVQRWVYIFLGRLLHELRRFDKWQIMPFLKGKAGTGKSLIALIAMAFFEKHQVGNISSNGETVFGLSAHKDAFMVVCLEVKKNFKLDQAEWQSLVSGEIMTIAEKHKTATQKRWTAPGLFCGNEWASYQDSQGSVQRRLAVLNFGWPVSSRDKNPQLETQIKEEELAALIIKCNIAYREMADRMGDQDIWKALPEYFEQQKRNLSIETDPLWATIWDLGIFEHTPVGYVSYQDFVKEYVQKHKLIRANNYPEALDPSRLSEVLKDAKAKVEEGAREDPATPGAGKKTGKWILGLRLRRDVQDDAALARASACT